MTSPAITVASDNWAGACPSMFEALAAVNAGGAASYGLDRWTEAATAAVADAFECDPDGLEVVLVVSGTAANALALAAATPPWGLVFAHDRAHIATDENGAPELFSGGARVVAIPGALGRMDPTALEARLAETGHGVHSPVPAVTSITQPTECGTVYGIDHVRALASTAHDAGLVVHMDGARLANAIVHLGCTPADATWRAGVDVLSLGATKGGALDMDAIVVFTPSRLADLDRHVKRAGHLPSKGRFLAAQLLAYLEDGRWLDNARHANTQARRLADGLTGLGLDLAAPVEANMVYVRLDPARTAALDAAGVHAYVESIDGVAATRMVTSWATTEDEVDALIDLLATSRGPGTLATCGP